MRSFAPRKEDLTAKLLATFKQLIAEGTLAPGSRLPAEREMASHLNVSRGSLRQVLKMLEIMGVVSQRVGDGTYLNAAAPSILSEPMEFLILLDGISFEELMEARLIVEPELAARAAARATPESLARLRQSLIGMEESAHDHAEVIQEDLRFHRTIFEMAGNRVCNIMFSIVHESLHGLMEVTSRLVGVKHTLKLHQHIYTAMRKGDPDEARARMIAHLVDAKGLLVRSHEGQMQERLESALQPLNLPAGGRRGR
jgi:GntR family transcriptional repressor for pyruvate dehydrogenase complex